MTYFKSERPGNAGFFESELLAMIARINRGNLKILLLITISFYFKW
ncbi:hypothetical protein B0F88_10488 [Methylobacter tundripaludum]|uniref:Uncharacterized protein n=1 Tax=Methylobacter tundripaludum TaxID=173365 RepID=A0A2S6H4I3_9GAMM|nr:hypothetical protein B0F88_10488 [Methylobacter tundripaludum]